MAKERQIKNVQDVRDRLEVLYLNLEGGATRAADAKELANIAGKMITTAKLELEEKVFLKDRTPVAFLHPE